MAKKDAKPAHSCPCSCIHEVFAAQAARTPDADAVVFEESRLTYRELDRRANQLARYLRRLGVGPEVPVGLCLERSLEMVVGVLGVLKAGGAYLPLDPAYPKDRLALMLQETGAPVLLTQERLLPALPGHGSRVVCLDAGWDVIAAESDAQPESGVMPDNLAYIIYTSGSTGRPKGTMLTHRGLPSLGLLQGDFYGTGPGGRTLQFASLSFDASVFEMFLTLCRGGALVLGRSEELRDPRGLAALLAEKAVTFTVLPPTVIAQLPLDAGPALQVLAAAGESCPAPLAASWAARVRFVNAYGPTEATVSSTAFPVPEGIDISRPLPIGAALPNVRAFVLDDRLEPAPVGVAGEICIGGAGVARGYLGRAGLTAERFVPDHLSGGAGARMYRTGDVGRLLPDGNIEFLGRADDQVKVRGFRVEPGEIEVVLNQHPGVRQAVVVARADRAGASRLVAYIVPAAAPAPVAAGLREHLAGKLPSFMIPSAFVALPELPLTPGGKVDKSALPAPEGARPQLSTEFVAPRTAVERALAATWEDLFGLDQVGVEDDFFELGGHSLLATQIVARARDAWGVELPLHQVFAAPSVAELARVIEDWARRGGEGAAGGAKATMGGARAAGGARIRPVPRDGALPLSFSQERVWFLLQLDPGNMAYNAQATLRLRGRLDVGALERSLGEIVRRHEIFRTTFPAVDGRPVQVTHEPWPVRLPVIDLGALPAGERAAELDRRVAAAIARPFDVTALPLARWTLHRLSATEHVLLHVEHHLVHDGWSFSVFMRELVALYEAFADGRPSPLPEPALQFADFAAWQRRWLEGEEAGSQLEFWKARLGGSPLVLELPADRARPPVQTFRGTAIRVDLEPGLWAAIKAASRRAGASAFMTMLAAFKVLLYRYTGQSDVVVGTGTANRRWRETEDLIGMIINNIALRTDLGGDPTFYQAVSRVRQVALEAYANQDLPFDRVVDAVQPVRDFSRNPVYQVMFSFHDNPMPRLDLPGLDIDIKESLSNGSAKFDLNVVVIPRPEQQVALRHGGGPGAAGAPGAAGGGVTLVWEYNTDLFDAATMERMLGHYRNLLAAAVADPQARISTLPAMGADEYHQVVCEWNATRREYPAGRCIHELFEEQVQRTPGAVAVTFAGRQLTYRELNVRANQLAHHLRRLGVGPEVTVGILVERSLEMVVGILGILKAGGAYLPLDPAYPEKRLAFMVEDAGAPVILTQERPAPGLPATGLPAARAAVVLLDAGWERIAAGGAENPESGATPENLAYVMYTSGSTGRPKGVMLPHRGVCNLAATQEDRFGIRPDDRVLQFTTLCFDVSVWEIFLTLTRGATLVLARAEELRDPELLARVLEREAVSAALLLPSVLSQLAPEAGPDLRTLVTGAEPCPPALAAALAGRLRFVNAYGPTEATVCVTGCRVPPDVDASRPVPIGRPLPNCQVYILDAWMQPVPVGAPGEVYIGGVCLARGYHDRPRATAEAFIPNPFGAGAGSSAGSRLYRTGDLARFRADGNLEFLGRIDGQVKVRGHRIELGEIDAVLAQHPGVRDAVTATHDGAPGGRRLYAYVVPRSGRGATAADLGAFLRDRLPEYMVPSAFVTLDELPLMPSGKVDRRALPVPDLAGLREKEYVAPRTADEEALAGIWARVLGVDRVGIHDNFFELGGHSLLATQIVSRVRSAMGVEVSLRAFFTAVTLADLAALLAGERARQGGRAGASGPAGPAADDIRPARPSDAGRLLAELEHLSDGEVDELLDAFSADEEVS